MPPSRSASGTSFHEAAFSGGHGHDQVSHVVAAEYFNTSNPKLGLPLINNPLRGLEDLDKLPFHSPKKQHLSEQYNLRKEVARARGIDANLPGSPLARAPQHDRSDHPTSFSVPGLLGEGDDFPTSSPRAYWKKQGAPGGEGNKFTFSPFKHLAADPADLDGIGDPGISAHSAQRTPGSSTHGLDLRSNSAMVVGSPCRGQLDLRIKSLDMASLSRPPPASIPTYSKDASAEELAREVELAARERANRSLDLRGLRETPKHRPDPAAGRAEVARGQGWLATGRYSNDEPTAELLAELGGVAVDSPEYRAIMEIHQDNIINYTATQRAGLPPVSPRPAPPPPRAPSPPPGGLLARARRASAEFIEAAQGGFRLFSKRGPGGGAGGAGGGTRKERMRRGSVSHLDVRSNLADMERVFPALGLEHASTEMELRTMRLKRLVRVRAMRVKLAVLREWKGLVGDEQRVLLIYQAVVLRMSERAIRANFYHWVNIMEQNRESRARRKVWRARYARFQYACREIPARRRLFRAAAHGDDQEVKEVINLFPHLLFEKNGDGLTPMQVAGRAHHHHVVRLILSRGVTKVQMLSTFQAALSVEDTKVADEVFAISSEVGAGLTVGQQEKLVRRRDSIVYQTPSYPSYNGHDEGGWVAGFPKGRGYGAAVTHGTDPPRKSSNLRDVREEE